VNGIRVGKEIGTVSGYMYQDDLFCDFLTVSEHLHFMVRATSSVFQIQNN